MNFISKKKLSLNKLLYFILIVYNSSESASKVKKPVKKFNKPIIKEVKKNNIKPNTNLTDEEDTKIEIEENNSEPYLNKATIAEISQKNTHGQQVSKDQFILALKREIEKLKQKIIQLQKLLNKEGGGFKKLKEDYEKSLKDLASANQLYIQLQNRNKQEIAKKDEEIKKLKNEIYKHIDQINNLKKEALVLDNKIKKIEKENLEKSNKIIGLNNNIDETKELLMILKNKKEILELLILHYRNYIKELIAVK